MRVLMGTPSYYPIKGGAETVVRNLSLELNRIGVSVDVMTFNMDRKWNPKWKGKMEKIDGITIFRVPALDWLPIEHSPRITLGINLIPGRFTNLLKEYDIIHFHEVDFSFPLFSFFVKKPKILHIHGIDVSFFKRYHLSRIILKNAANLYIAIFQSMADELAELGIPEYKIKHLPNGIDTNVFHPSWKKKKGNLVLFVGRIERLKGLHVLLESLRYIQKPIHLVIVGPFGWNNVYSNSILTTINKTKEETNHILTYLGELEREEIIKWYQQASILIRPDLYETCGGLTSIEALACGTPVIATGNEVVKNGFNGILVPRNDSVKLADAIQYLLDNEGIRKKLGKEGRVWVEKNLSNEVIVENLSQIYKELIR